MRKILAAILAFFTATFGSLFHIAKPTSFNNISYGPETRQVLDMRIPYDADYYTGLILFIHGGGFISGDKTCYLEDIDNWAKKGYITAEMNYRYVSDEITIYDILDDVSAALQKIYDVAAAKNIIIPRCILCGYSAGAQISMMYAYTKKDIAPIKPVAVVSYSGMSDLTSSYFKGNTGLGTPESVANLFSMTTGYKYTPETRDAGAETALAKASPINYINSNTVPTLIVHGYLDDIVPYQDACHLAQKLVDNGVPCEFVTLPKAGHGLGGDKKHTKQALKLFEKFADCLLPHND